MLRKIIFGVSIIVIVILSLPLLLICKIKNDDYFTLKCLRFLSKLINTSAGNKVNLKNQEILFNNNNYILIANHLSIFDVFGLYSFLDKPLVFIAKKELLKIPIASSWLKLGGTIFVDRGDSRNGLTMVQSVIRSLKNGENVGIMPTGTRSTEQLPFKSGVIKIAKKSKVNILPLTIENTNLIFENRKNNKKINSYYIFHNIISYKEYKDVDVDILTSNLENIVYKKDA